MEEAYCVEALMHKKMQIPEKSIPGNLCGNRL